MKSKKPQVFFIKNEVYPFDVLISIGETDEQFVKTIARNLPPDAIEELENDLDIVKLGKTTLARTMMFETNQIVIRFKNKPITCKDHGVIAHELFHAAEFILRVIKTPLTPDSNEVYAYLIGFLTTKFYEKL